MDASAMNRLIPTEQADRPVLAAAGDRICEACSALNPIWFTHSPLWNRVKGGPRAAGDPGGVLCPRCFMARADHALGEQVWAIIPAADQAESRILDALEAARGYIGHPARTGLPRDRQRDGLIDRIDGAILLARLAAPLDEREGEAK